MLLIEEEKASPHKSVSPRKCIHCFLKMLNFRIHNIYRRFFLHQNVLVQLETCAFDYTGYHFPCDKFLENTS